MSDPDTHRAAANSTQIAGSHYVTKPMQVWDFIHRNGIGYLAGNVIKYLSRYKEKGGIADLEKARHYIEKLIEEERAPACAEGEGRACGAGETPTPESKNDEG